MRTLSPKSRSIALTFVPLVLVASVLAGACVRDAASTSAVTRTDSAGVRIYTSTATDIDLPWRFETIDVLRDSAGEPVLFTSMHPRAVLTDRAGRTYVLQHDLQTIHRFSREGLIDRAFGRKGSGPGEMQFPIALGVNADTLFVLDLMKQALVRWSPELAPIGDRRLEGTLAHAEGIAYRTGGFWAMTRAFSERGSEQRLIADTTGAPLLSLALPKGSPVDFGCVSISSMDPLLSPNMSWSNSGPRLLASLGGEYVLWLYEGARPLASLRRPIPRRAPTIDDVRQVYPEGMVVRFGGERDPCRVSVEKVFATIPLAKEMPFVFNVALLSDGTMWVQRTPNQAADPLVDVFGPDGAYAGTVRGMRIPVGMLPNGELLVPQSDTASGGTVLARVRVRR